MSWKKSANRTIYGEKVLLGIHNDEDGTDEVWFRPRKWSVSAQDAIAEEAQRLRESLGPEVIELMKHRQDILSRIEEASAEGGELSQSEILELMSPEELQSLLRGVAPSKRYDLIWTELYYGIGSHNYKDDDGQVIDDTAALVSQILDYPEITEAMIEAVEELNRPLVNKLVGSSEKRSITPSTTPSSPSTRTKRQTG